MAELFGFLRWLITYAVEHGFWHFWAVLLVIWGICKITTLFRVEVKVPKELGLAERGRLTAIEREQKALRDEFIDKVVERIRGARTGG